MIRSSEFRIRSQTSPSASAVTWMLTAVAELPSNSVSLSSWSAKAPFEGAARAADPRTPAQAARRSAVEAAVRAETASLRDAPFAVGPSGPSGEGVKG